MRPRPLKLDGFLSGGRGFHRWHNVCTLSQTPTYLLPGEAFFFFSTELLPSRTSFLWGSEERETAITCCAARQWLRFKSPTPPPPPFPPLPRLLCPEYKDGGATQAAKIAVLAGSRRGSVIFGAQRWRRLRRGLRNNLHLCFAPYVKAQAVGVTLPAGSKTQLGGEEIPSMQSCVLRQGFKCFRAVLIGSRLHDYFPFF